MVCTAPLTMSMSSQPSLSKSNHAVPNPVYGAARRAEPGSRALLLEQARPVVDVQVVPFARQVRDEQVFVAVVVEVAGVDAHAGLRLSRARSAPCPDSRPVFLNVPSCWLIHSWFGWPSLAT